MLLEDNLQRFLTKKLTHLRFVFARRKEHGLNEYPGISSVTCSSHDLGYHLGASYRGLPVIDVRCPWLLWLRNLGKILGNLTRITCIFSGEFVGLVPGLLSRIFRSLGR